MDTRVAKEFRDACDEAFGFLVADHGFQPAALEINQQIDFAVVSFLGRNVAVECVFDERESCVDVNIVRVTNGTTTTDYSTDSRGNRVREGLYSLLIRRGVRGFGPRTERLSEKPVMEMFRIILSNDADLLKRHGADIIDDSPSVFAA